MSSNQADFLSNVLSHADPASEAGCVQKAWDNDSPVRTGTVHTEATDPNDDEFGAFVTASTDPLKRPIYHGTEDTDETVGLLNTKSTPVWETGTFLGVGIVEPVRAGIGMSTRTVLRATKLARWKLNLSRVETIIEEHKKKRLHGTGCAAVPAASTSANEDDPNQYIEVPRTATSFSDMNGVMRPVSFTGPAIDELMETERRAWAP